MLQGRNIVSPGLSTSHPRQPQGVGRLGADWENGGKKFAVETPPISQDEARGRHTRRGRAQGGDLRMQKLLVMGLQPIAMIRCYPQTMATGARISSG